MPIQFIEENSGKVVEVHVSGKVTKADFQHFVPEFERQVQQNGKLRLLFDITGFNGWEVDALWEEIKFDIKYFSDIELPDLIFTGLIGERLPAGVTKAQAVAQLRATGQARIADMVSAMDVVPGRGVDFGAVGYVLLAVLVLYVAASVLSWVQGRVATVIVQHTVYEMRAEVEAKFSRMPLSYFDSKPRGELLSRVTNDIDNVAQSMQQTLSQLLTSLLTVI